LLLWRISNHISLDGGGGLRASHRWHTRGRPIVYCAPNPATALLEVLVHAEIDVEDLPTRYRFLKIEAPDGISIDRVNVAELPAGWQDDSSVTRRIGDAWLQSRRTTLLEVPSVLVPETFNVLLNPVHTDAARVRIVEVLEHVLDPRLLR
jgi:RES domain-containing protein